MNARTPLLVGSVLLLAAGSLTWFVTTTSKDKFDEDSSYVIFADFSDASGLRSKTRVQINGIDVGKIETIEHVALPDGQLVARVKLRILENYVLYQNATLKKAAESLLGDFRLDLRPGTPSAPVLPPGAVIGNVQSQSDIDAIQSELKSVVANVNKITESFSKVLAGPEGQGSLQAIMDSVERSMAAIESATSSLSGVITRNDESIESMLIDLSRFSRQLADASSQGGDLQATVANAARISKRLDSISESLEEVIVGSGEKGEKTTLRESIEHLNHTVSQLNSIVGKVDKGEGTLGRVINDPSIANKVEQTVEDAGNIIGGVARLAAQVELRSEYGIPVRGASPTLQPGIKNYLSLRLYPRPDKYYILEAVSDPRGVQRRTVTSTTPESTTGATSVDQTVTSFNDLKFSAQLAKRFYWSTLRFGIIENTGGLGTNIHLANDKLEMRFDWFDFNRRDLTKADRPILPRVRGNIMYEFYNHLFLQAGVDDPLNKELFTWIFGGGLRFTDEDLRSILVVAPKP